MATTLHNTNVNLDGLLEVLGKNLYSSPSVAIREIVQNAHDACIRRKIEAPSETDLSIRINIDSNKNTLTIHDNGSGLTQQEVKQYLATIGSGYTRVLRNQSQTDEMIGYFGLGFLSAYVIADKVEVWTTSYQTPEQSWHFVSKGGKQFSIGPCTNREIGTTVKLKLKNNFSELSSHNVLESLLTKFCCLLPIPIFLESQQQPINHLVCPWRMDQNTSTLKLKKERLKFAEIFEDTFAPICVIPIPQDNTLNVNGLIWIQDSSGFSTSDYRNGSVFVRNMFISNEGRELLPLWAGFVGCVVESNQLTPTASREDIQKDQVYHDLQDLLASTLTKGLKHIAENETENWRRILARHNQALTGAAVNDDGLFDLLKNEIKLPSSSGDMTVNALLKKSENRLYLRTEDSNSYEDILFKSKMIPVVSGYLFAAASFCYKYADTYHVKIIELGTQSGNEQMFKILLPEPMIQNQLISLIKTPGDEILFTQFAPEHIAMIIIDNQDVLLKKRIEQDDSDKRIGRAALILAKMHTNTISDENIRKVYINMDSPLVQRLIDLSEDGEKSQQLSRLLRSFTVSLCHNTSDETVDFNDELIKFSQTLLETFSSNNLEKNT
ncbi:MAG: ATP-binding protein [Proteobacteria bacterium]|nr:ATP-binding protein [Pseudomonadota bacterium]